MKTYRSSIPKEAKERILAFHIEGRERYMAEYLLDGLVVGVRYFNQKGELELERPMKHGLSHGTLYTFDSGVVTFAEAYRNGLAHGTAKQWSCDGQLVGTYTMKHGTGLDLWRCKNERKNKVVLMEARFLKGGERHGFEWWLNDDQKSVYEEHHFWEGIEHGIERHWNTDGCLKR